MFIAFMRSNSAIPLTVKLKDRACQLRISSGNWKEASWPILQGPPGVAAIAGLVLLLAWPVETSFWQTLSGLQSSWWGIALIAWAIGAGLVLVMPWRRFTEDADDAKTEEELRRGVA